VIYFSQRWLPKPDTNWNNFVDAMTNVAITPNCEQAVLHVSSFVFTLQSTTDCDIWHGTLAVH